MFSIAAVHSLHICPFRKEWARSIYPLIWFLLVTFPINVCATEFIRLGDLPGGEFDSAATAVTDDGKVACGYSDSGGDRWEAFRWTQAEGIVGLGEISGGMFGSVCTALSADGDIAVGYSNTATGLEAFRWSSATGLVGLGGFPIESNASDISADGQAIVGDGWSYMRQQAFKWTQVDKFFNLGDLGGGRLWAFAEAISGNGQVVVGGAESSVDIFEAFRWTSASGMVGLGKLPGATSHSRATDVSHDGEVIVGVSDSHAGRRAFRWTEDEGMIDLGAIPSESDVCGYQESEADSVSGDGEIVVGTSSTEKCNEVFIWTQSSGIGLLQDVLVSQGISELSEWERIGHAAISPNGRWIAGTGENPEGQREAFIASLNRDDLSGFSINAGLNDAWYNPATNGQGFLITALPAIQSMFVAWFTFDTERPPLGTPSGVGEPGHRWLIAQGPYSGDTATMTIYVSKGGVFDSVSPAATTDPAGDGTLTIEFADCVNAMVTYDITSAGLSGEIPIERIAGDNVALCESLAGQ